VRGSRRWTAAGHLACHSHANAQIALLCPLRDATSANCTLGLASLINKPRENDASGRPATAVTHSLGRRIYAFAPRARKAMTAIATSANGEDRVPALALPPGKPPPPPVVVVVVAGHAESPPPEPTQVSELIFE
jgi:hypothetical protein